MTRPRCSEDWDMMPTACGASAQEAKQARASFAAKNIGHARPHGGQPHKIHHRQPQKERHPHHALRTATALLRRMPQAERHLLHHFMMAGTPSSTARKSADNHHINSGKTNAHHIVGSRIMQGIAKNKHS